MCKYSILLLSKTSQSVPMRFPSSLTKFRPQLPSLKKMLHTIFWFVLGAILGVFFFSGLVALYYQQTYENKVFPGITIEKKDFGGKTKDEVAAYFQKKNERIQDKTLSFTTPQLSATISAQDLEIGYDEELLATQAYSIGRGDNILSNLYLIFQAYLSGISLEPSYHYAEVKLAEALKPLEDIINTEPIDAKFSFENGRVTEFRSAKEGKSVDTKAIKETLIPFVLNTPASSSGLLVMEVPITTVEPEVTTEEANDLGIRERIGVGTSLFAGSIENRIYNLTLASNRINGTLVKPGEIFSFNKTVGDISTLTGYKQAYVISGGRTVLGDGGGVCQVSTTLFRAILDAGLPITERNPHAYRVGYYEQDSLPGIDAAIYTPTVDLKFKNDTGHHILIQTFVNPTTSQLTFELYGTNDGRISVVHDPVIVSQTPAPEPLYQDDPNLPKGEIKQIDFAAPGAVVYFTREVTRDGKVIISDKYTSNYRAWQAVYLRGTKEG